MATSKKTVQKGMNKDEFVNFIADMAKISKSEALKSLNHTINGFIHAMKKGKGVNITNFGSFQVQDRPARDGRNPKTGEKMKIKAYKQPVFKAGKLMKDSTNGKDSTKEK